MAGVTSEYLNQGKRGKARKGTGLLDFVRNDIKAADFILPGGMVKRGMTGVIRRQFNNEPENPG